jgi:signal transduction histidine kinase
MGLSVSSLTFRTVAIVDAQPVPTPGPGIALFGLFSIAMNGGAIGVLVRRLRGAMDPIARKQTMLVTEGIMVMFGLIITTIFLPLALFGSNRFVYLMPFYTLLFLLMTAYAVVAYRLFNIKVVATEAVSTLLLIVLLSRAIIAEDTTARLINFLIFGMTAALSLMLVHGVRKEIQQREEVQKLATGLADANQKLQELNDMKSNFVSIASHQLRAPIGGVRGYLLLMQEGDYGKVPKKMLDIYGQCIDQLDHLLHVINMFLDVTKMESGKIELTKEKTDLRPLAESAVKDNQRGADNKGLKLTLELPKQTLEAVVDGAKIREIMFNFIENAIKYTQSGSVAASLARTPDAVEFRVKDTGMGIVPEEVPKLFAKFVRAGGGFRVAHGSGLGLYIAKTMAEAHGGSVFVESAGEGKGSTFGFRLPLPAEASSLKTRKKGK